MSTFVKKYPRALIKKQPKSNGWTIDLIQRAGVKPKRVAATYAGIPWAHKAARSKLGLPALPAATAPAPKPAVPAAEPTPGQLQATDAETKVKDYGTCKECKHPLRPVGTKASQYPGTRLRQRQDLCQSCHLKAWRKAQASK